MENSAPKASLAPTSARSGDDEEPAAGSSAAARSTSATSASAAASSPSSSPSSSSSASARPSSAQIPDELRVSFSSLTKMGQHRVKETLAPWAGYFEKPVEARQESFRLVYPHLDPAKVLDQGGLPIEVANNMIENCIGTIGLPLGVAPNFIIDGKHFVVPMCTEEPSVIAACSGAAKLVAAHGGFVTSATGSIMTAQIQILGVQDLERAAQIVQERQKELITVANTFCKSMKRRGGGVVDIFCRVVPARRRSRADVALLAAGAAFGGASGANGGSDAPPSSSSSSSSSASSSASGGPSNSPPQGMLVVHLQIDVQEAMGANVCNTVAEGVAPRIVRILQESDVAGAHNARAGLRILTNLCMERRAKAAFRIPLAGMEWKGTSGEAVAQRMLEAYYFAEDDPFRAATHNKGIMNGIDAVAVATGQDWRAVEAGAHTWASRTGYYQSLTKYRVESVAGVGPCFVGELELPMAVGSKGGALATHPVYKFTHALLGNPSASRLARIIVSAGLAQNFAAMRALAIQGINRGHMKLHARNIAAAAGVPQSLVGEVANYMVKRQAINKGCATEYMDAHSIYVQQPVERPQGAGGDIPPSTFYVELQWNPADKEEVLELNVVFETLGTHPVHVVVNEGGDGDQEWHQKLLGSNHGYEWLTGMYRIFHRIKLAPQGATRDNLASAARLKLISSLLNLVATQLVNRYPQEMFDFLDVALHTSMRKRSLDRVPLDKDILCVGLPLVLALWQRFEWEVKTNVKPVHPELAEQLENEQRRIVLSIYDRPGLRKRLHRVDLENPHSSAEELAMLKLEAFVDIHGKRWQATMVLLCDAVSYPPHQLTMERLMFLRKIGAYFEFEGLVSHDISRLQRDLSEGTPNAVGVWMASQGIKEHAQDVVDEFVAKLFDPLTEKRKSVVMQYEKVLAKGNFFDARSFLVQSTRAVRQHYQIRSPLAATSKM